MEPALPTLHEAASHHLPPFITAPGQSDWLFNLMAIVMIAAVLGVGVFFFWLHSLPERMVHHKVQFDLVAVLALLSLFTHIHAFWVAALIIAFIDFPDISFPNLFKSFDRMAGSLETLADAQAHSTAEKSSSPGSSPSSGPRPLPTAQVKGDSQSSAAHADEPPRKREAGHA
jgi:hypothetical protein